MPVALSIVTPAFDTPRELFEACAESIFMQDFEDFEWIVVDDGSDPSFAAIYDEVVGRDARARVIHIGNEGVSQARNRALEESCGTFITFVDSDDLVVPGFFSAALRVANETGADLVAGRVRYLMPSQTLEPQFSRGKHVLIFRGRELESLVRTFLTKVPVDDATSGLDGFAAYTLYPKIYRRSLSEGIRFDSRMTIGEDSFYSLQLAERADCIALVDEAWYEYRVRSESTTHTTDVDRICEQLKSFEAYDDLREEHGWSASDVGMRVFQSFVNILNANAPSRSFWQMVKLCRAMVSTPSVRMVSWIDVGQYRLSATRRVLLKAVRMRQPVLIALLSRFQILKARVQEVMRNEA